MRGAVAASWRKKKGRCALQALHFPLSHCNPTFSLSNSTLQNFHSKVPRLFSHHHGIDQSPRQHTVALRLSPPCLKLYLSCCRHLSLRKATLLYVTVESDRWLQINTGWIALSMRFKPPCLEFPLCTRSHLSCPRYCLPLQECHPPELRGVHQWRCLVRVLLPLRCPALPHRAQLARGQRHGGRRRHCAHW